MADNRAQELKELLPQCLLPDWVRLGSRAVRLFRDRHHPEKHEALLNRLLVEARASIEQRQVRARNLPIVSYPPDLPITARKDEIVAAIRAHQVVVIAGETGSGKTTQIPKMCLEAGLGIEAKIGCTQPRRVAALSISQRIAEELNVNWGHEVGCKIRFDDRSNPSTYIKLMTDGILLAETQGDPTLADYNAIILDEAHERSLNIDFLLGYLKGLLAQRKDLKLIVTSATIDTRSFSDHFDNAPIIEVSGRLYPVDVRYQPIDVASEENGDITFVDAAVREAERIFYESDAGDLLIFMPGERDIRETADQLEGRFPNDADVIPLCGRLSSDEQQRVFASSRLRKIVIATNIAETSLTIPGIRYVIDTGLARLSRYNPRTRTRRLPIEPISQSSANQRKGRAGRVEDGFCIRLYSEEDFLARPAFTTPEIQRSNLAEVILRMKAFGLGEIETFPFLQPPTPAAIANGYTLLQELGALDGSRSMTPLGHQLARLPIDPTLGRMLLQSQNEHATRELLIIAAGLSIQDPRERPLDQKDAAAAAHKKFNDPQSDFLALLNIWNAAHEEWETLRTQNQRRKFCKRHFLSYLRMREWQDLHAQLHDALDNLGTLKLNESNATHDAIHRSILAGLLGHVARHEERNVYKGAGNRLLSVFPGSVLHERGEPPKKHGHKSAPPPRSGSNQPEWIVAGEIVETSQLFARTLARISPEWIFALAPHCCKVSHQNPRWVPKAGQVMVDELITLHGMEVQRRKVAYGLINPAEATEIFIRSALVEENLLPGNASADEKETPRAVRDLRPLTLDACRESKIPGQYQFLIRNRAIREKIENWQTRVRQHGLANPDETLFKFYARHLQNVSSIHDLNRVLREQADPDFLCVPEAELAGGQTLGYDAGAFPDAVPLGGQPVALSYAYAPGEAHDGVTVQLPFSLVNSASAALLEWAVPGLRSEKISEMLRSLPKAIRRELMPFPPKVAEIVEHFTPNSSSFLDDLGRFIHQRYGVEVPASAWPPDALPSHLRPRIEVIDSGMKILGSGRDLDQLRRQLEKVKVEPAKEPPAWRQAIDRWERFSQTSWMFGDLPERITISEDPILPLYAWPGLELENGAVNLRLFRSIDLAHKSTRSGLQRLVELAIQKDLAWLEKDLRALKNLAALYAPIGTLDELQETAMENLKRHILDLEPLPELTEAYFKARVGQARERAAGVAQRLISAVTPILQMRQQIQARIGESVATAVPRGKILTNLSQLGQSPVTISTPSPWASALTALLPARFLEVIPFDRLPHLPRFLKALLTRIDRAALNPVRDKERALQLAPYEQTLKKMAAAKHEHTGDFRWLLEELKVSLFAQELGTSTPISAKRLDQQLDQWGFKAR